MENNEQKQAESNANSSNKNISQKQIAAAVLLAGVLIAGAILLKGNTQPPQPAQQQAMQQAEDGADVANPANVADTDLLPVSAKDHMLGNSSAPVTFVEYADFQCPFCGIFYKQTEPTIIKDYVDTGKINFVYRDYAFLGPESVQAAEAAQCADDQGKYWDYNNYLFSHQNGENQGAFVDKNLETFAKILGLNTTTFNQCLESGKYADMVAQSATDGTTAGVKGTPKGFIVKDGKVVATMDGAEPLSTIIPKIDAALK